MNNIYETVGDVRGDIDAAVASDGLRAVGGRFYVYTRALSFGLVDQAGNRQGDAHCALPEGGWMAGNYWPRFIGEPTSESDCLRLNVVKGAGRLVLSADSKLALQAEFGGLPYRIINDGSELLIVRANSAAFPANATDINCLDEGQGLSDDFALASKTTFSYNDAFGPDSL